MVIGFNTVFMVLNDGLTEIKRNPEEFVDTLITHAGSLGHRAAIAQREVEQLQRALNELDP